MYLKLDGETILGHAYEPIAGYDQPIDDIVLVNSEGNYIYKYTNELVSLNPSEINSHPNKLKKEQGALILSQVAIASKWRELGQSVIDLISYLTNQKQLTLGQKKILGRNAKLKDIKEFLSVGSLLAAYDEIVNYTPDGILITTDDKNKVISLMNEYLGL